MTGQTSQVAPADKKLYALRDATATVETIPLIVASIISKKGAAGLDAMVIDVKTGTGAFMRETGRARELAQALVRTGNSLGVRTEALITDMNQPLGRAVGNAVEVRECIEILRGEGQPGALPVLDLSIELAARMVMLSGLKASLDEARHLVRRTLDSGQALEKFRANVEAQSGNPRVCDDPARFLPLTENAFAVESPRSGFLLKTDSTEIGQAVATAGGGRIRMDDEIDPTVGFVSDIKIGDRLSAGDLIGTVYCRDDQKGRETAARIQAAYQLGDTAPAALELVKEVIAE
jgi:pyrimidine-nucleoside phosphorylase